MKRTLEVDYQKALLLRTSLEFRDHAFFARKTGAIKVEDRYFRAGIKGQADLYVIGRGGWHGEVELKRDGDLSEAQAHWRDWCQARSVPWLLLRAFRKEEQPPQTIERWLRELRAWLPDMGTARSSALG